MIAKLSQCFPSVSVLLVIVTLHLSTNHCDALRVVASACNYTSYVNSGGRHLFYEAQYQPGYCEIPFHKSLRRQVCCNCIVIHPNEVCQPGAAAPKHWNTSLVLTNLEGLVRLSVQYGQDREYWYCCNQQWFEKEVQPQYRAQWIRELQSHEKGQIEQPVIKQIDEDSIRDERKIAASGKFSTKPSKLGSPPESQPNQFVTSKPVTQRPVFTRETIKPVVQCFDAHKSCDVWAKSGYCNTNLWVHRHCQRTCDTCTFHSGNSALLPASPRPTTTFRPPTSTQSLTIPTTQRQRITTKRSISTFQSNNNKPAPNSDQFFRTITESTVVSRSMSCKLEAKPSNECLVGVQPSKIRWYFDADHYECLAFYDKSCAEDTRNMNRFESWSSCSRQCKMADAPSCSANSVPAEDFNGLTILCNPGAGRGNTGCPSDYNCVQGAFFALCCSKRAEETYERNYNPRCQSNHHMERYEEQGLVMNLLGRTCADNFCSPSSECVQLEKFAHCCSSERLSFRRTDETGHLLFL